MDFSVVFGAENVLLFLKYLFFFFFAVSPKQSKLVNLGKLSRNLVKF